MEVLSLGDGISCIQPALKEAGITNYICYASEIDEDAKRVTQKNFPDTIDVGDMKLLKGKYLPKIDLFVCGSNCQDLSVGGSKKKEGRGLFGERSILFFEALRLLKEVNPTYFLFENVVMNKQYLDIISEALGVEPVKLNSSLVSAQNRQRNYWTTIPNITQPKDRRITLNDIIYDDSYKNFSDIRINKSRILCQNYVQWDKNGKGHKSQQHRAYYKKGHGGTITSSGMNLVVDLNKDIYRRMHIIEAERCQTLPDNYTDINGISLYKRWQLVGNGFTVDLIAHILKGLK